MATGFLLFLATWSWLGRGSRRDGNYVANLLTVLILSALFGARTAYVLEHWSDYAQAPWTILRIDQGGLMFYGGLLGAWIALSVFARVHRERWLDFLDLLITAVPIGHTLGRIGCFLEGCCFGDRTDGACAVTYPVGSHAWRHQLSQGLIGYYDRPLPVVPVQLLEAGANLLIYGLLLWHYRRRTREGEQVALYAVLYATARYLLEMLRADPRMAVGPFSISQLISLGILGFGIALALYLRRHGRPPVRPEIA